MTPADIATGTRLIRSAIAQHMPSAAVASGWVSAVSPEPWISWVSGLLPYQDRPTGEGCYGLTRLTAWLKTQGITAGESYIRELRKEWLTVAMAVESRRSPGAVYIHARPA
jgi:hypothetical protein